jgi:hypothetical protein
MSYGEEQKRKNARQNKIILIALFLILTNFTTFIITSSAWINKYIEAEHRAEVCLPMQPKIPTQKVLI